MKAALDQTAQTAGKKSTCIRTPRRPARRTSPGGRAARPRCICSRSPAGPPTPGPIPDWRLDVLTLPKWDGGGPAAKHLSVAGYAACVAIKKASEDRVREILRFADFIASPFGTTAELLVNYGVAGTHYKLAGTRSGRDAAGQGATCRPAWPTSAARPPRSSTPRTTGRSCRSSTTSSRPCCRPASANPTDGLYSETRSTSGASARRALEDLQTQIIIGRKPLSDWDAAVARWRNEAGDQQRQDYQDQLQDR